MRRAAPPLTIGDVVVVDHRVPPFHQGETLLVAAIKNIGTHGNPHWRAHLRSQRGVVGWLDTTSLVRL